jgi:hypothetical protein
MNPSTLTILDALLLLGETNQEISVEDLLGVDVVREIHAIDIRKSLSELQDAGYISIKTAPGGRGGNIPPELSDIVQIELLAK